MQKLVPLVMDAKALVVESGAVARSPRAFSSLQYDLLMFVATGQGGIESIKQINSKCPDRANTKHIKDSICSNLSPIAGCHKRQQQQLRGSV